MVEGFAAAKVLAKGLRRAGPKPRREKVQTALEGIRKFDIGGLEISYADDDRPDWILPMCPSLKRMANSSDKSLGNRKR